MEANLRLVLVFLLFFVTCTAAAQSKVLDAVFIVKDQGFMSPDKNEALQAVLREKPTLDVFEACVVGDIARVKELLKKDPTLATAFHKRGWTPLHLAAFGGNAEIVQLLLDHGAKSQVNARAKTRFKNTPLQTSLLTGQYATAKLLLDNGADPLVRQHLGFAPIHEAAFLDRRDLVDLLLEHGAEIDARTNDGRTAITEARRRGHDDMAEYLKSKGATELQGDVTKEPAEPR